MKAEFLKAMRKLVFPVSIVSTQKDGLKFAITVSSVTSVSIVQSKPLYSVFRDQYKTVLNFKENRTALKISA